MTDSERRTGFSRRRMLSLMGASIGLAGASACRRPEERIVPYTVPPEEVVPGRPLHFATTVPLFGTAYGLLVETHEGRPTKVEGNPLHPESCGKTTSFLQAMVLDLYDPDRSRGPNERGAARTWSEAAAMLQSAGEKHKNDNGRSLAILTEDHRSPTLIAAISDLRKALPETTVVGYEPFGTTESQRGVEIAFGRPGIATSDFARSKVLVTIDADPLGLEGGSIRAASAWAEGREATEAPNRLHCFESAWSITGSVADHRTVCSSRSMGPILAELTREILKALGLRAPPDLAAALESTGQDIARSEHADRIREVARDLADHASRSLILVGPRQPSCVHALALYANHLLGNVGTTLRLAAPHDDAPSGPDALAKLTGSLLAGRIETLLVLGGNPVYGAPADLEFGRALQRAQLSVHLATHVDETGSTATWHLNRAHPFESWGDALTSDGTASLIQPLIVPIFGARTDSEVVRMLLGQAPNAYDLVRETWTQRLGAADFDAQWRKALYDGVIAGTSTPRILDATPDTTAVARAMTQRIAPPQVDSATYEVVFSPDAHSYDGRFANNAWLQELPEAFTKLTWGNAAWISETAAAELDVRDGDHIDLAVHGKSRTFPVIVMPGQADRTVQITVGQGRRAGGRVALGSGVDAAPLRHLDAFHVAAAQVTKGRGRTQLARTQQEFDMHGRPLVREGTLDDFRRDPIFARRMGEIPTSSGLYRPASAGARSWAMTIDLNRCTGCSACVVACQAENNIPVVGPEGIARGRGMHWLRVDRYFVPAHPESGRSDKQVRTLAQPILCQQCEQAPCESVCPVGATAHTPEGLNDMVYNRCVGSRYCANNCPFKVRRFNYFEYSEGYADIRKLQFNPDVTVRSRGVMEKCTFCVQRINRGKIDAKRDGRKTIPDGEIPTACEQACPTRAITFGDQSDPASRVAQCLRNPRAYRLLEELNLRQRVVYLARLRNPMSKDPS